VSFLDRARVAATIRDARGRVRGVRVEGPQAGDYYADVIIDASGATSAIARETRLSPPGGPGHAVALRGYFEGDALRDDVIEFCFDAGVPRGYFWIFPLGDGVVNVGIAAYGGGAPLRPLLQRFLAGHGGGRLRGTRQRGALRGGTIPVLGDLASRVRDGLILAGDAAGFCDPLTFEGISYAMASGRLAAQAAAEALAEGSTAASVLQRYDGWWRERFGHYLLLLSELLRAPARATAGSPPRGSSFEAVFRRMMTLGAAA
jgi:flavin-dependent dehydrogenase